MYFLKKKRKRKAKKRKEKEKESKDMNLWIHTDISSFSTFPSAQAKKKKK